MCEIERDGGILREEGAATRIQSLGRQFLATQLHYRFHARCNTRESFEARKRYRALLKKAMGQLWHPAMKSLGR